MIDANERPPGRSMEGRVWQAQRTYDVLADVDEPNDANATGRRRFLQLMGASLGLAGVGLGGCLRQPDEKIVPYVRQPEDFVPGKPLFFATCTTLCGYATGVLVESHLGRPTKVEGNPDHPASLGATDIFAQASVLSLYDPDRSQTVVHAGQISTWAEFLTALVAELPSLRERKGRGLAILTETVTSPTMADQLQSLIAELPEAKWHQYEPVSRDNVRAGSKLAFDEYVDSIYHFDKADVVLSLDAELFAGLPGGVRYAREFVDRRRAVSAVAMKEARRNRLWAVESTPGLTGAMADHRLALPAAEVENFARIVAAKLNVDDGGGVAPAVNGVDDAWMQALLADLAANRGSSLVVAGEGQPAIVHALAHSMNLALGNAGKTIEYVAPAEAEPVDQLASLTELVDDMRQGRLQILLVLGGNPVYNAPGELDFAEHFDRVSLRIHLSEHFDETSFVSHWHVPAANDFESWGDARAFDGTVTLRQPLIAPLYGGKTAYEVLAAVGGRPERTTFEIVQGFWKARWGDDLFESRWSKAVHDGVVESTRSVVRDVRWSFRGDTRPTMRELRARDGVEVTFTPDPTVWDGRFANNGWLQELPKPLTKITWDNAALMSPRTAVRLGLTQGELIELSLDGRTIRVPGWIVPGQPDDSISLALGHGRTRAGRVGNKVGVDVYPLRPAKPEWFASGVTARGTGEPYVLAVTQEHHSTQGRGLVEIGTFAEFQKNPAFLDGKSHHADQLPSLYPKYEASENAWGMVIDQTACTGCNACVVACQAENNVPIVGKEQVAKGREMHWLRIDRYYKGELDSPETYFQPVACMHCENAPCELVCPVAATVHSHEGLNQMVYNRCVGTRYCSNNCPYKVRRFNFLAYEAELGLAGEQAPALKLLRNPDVTVRSRGVMEKCTYCVQRINEAKIEAGKQNRPVRDGEVVTACQAVCPTRAIVFGNINDPDSQVARLKKSPLDYSLLAELNTIPRTSYWARLRNPHPDLAGPSTSDTPPIVPSEIDRAERGDS
jgi:molybdopterin-containing oxidoreductase family iron-sulfur binding subunit